MEDKAGPAGEKKFLVVDDNLVNQKVFVAFLQKKGWHVVCVQDGKKAIQAVKTGDYDLVLMDVQMPEIDGLETTRQIRAYEAPNNLHIPIIAVTSFAMKGDREEFLAGGMDGYVSKPINREELYATIERFISD